MPPARDSTSGDSDATRRTVLKLIGAAGVAGVATSASAAIQEDGASYSVVQGDQCVPVEPLSGSDPVEQLYDYRVPEGFQGDNGATDANSGPYYQSNGTTDLQQADVSIAFLYDGPNGLSLVVVHDSPGSNAGGSVSFTVSGVPDGADWAVKDDLYLDPDNPDSRNFDNWNTGGTSHGIDWTWGSAGTDGGALRTSGDLGLTIEPAFNEAATFWGEHYAEDPITDWQFLSFPDGRSSPERTSLAMDQSVTITAEPCEKPVTGPLTADIDVKPGSDRNPINPKSQGVTPVALRSTDELDHGDVDVGSLRFGPPAVVDAGDGAKPEHGGHDEDDRLMLHFSTPAAGFEAGHSTAKLVGQTLEGQEVVGTADITIVGPANDREEEDKERKEEKEERKEERKEGKEERKKEKEERKEEKEERKEERKERKEERKEEKKERKEERKEEKEERKEERKEKKEKRKEEKEERKEEREEAREEEEEEEEEEDDD